MRRKTRVLIVGRQHPHRGETGILNSKDRVKPAGGSEMVRVALEKPSLGALACYVEAADLHPVADDYRSAT